MSEQFCINEVITAIGQWLQFGEQSYVAGKEPGELGHCGYFSGPGWAARCLRGHLEQLKELRDRPCPADRVERRPSDPTAHWDDFATWCEAEGVSPDWGPWWSCWNAALNAREVSGVAQYRRRAKDVEPPAATEKGREFWERVVVAHIRGGQLGVGSNIFEAADYALQGWQNRFAAPIPTEPTAEG